MTRFVPAPVLGLLAALVCGPAVADTAIGGWTVADRPGEENDCLASREYGHPADPTRRRLVAFRLGRDGKALRLLVALGYDTWAFPVDHEVKADLRLGNGALFPKARWTASQPGMLFGVFVRADAFADGLARADVLTLRLGQGDVLFETPGAGPALAAARRCLDAGR